MLDVLVLGVANKEPIENQRLIDCAQRHGILRDDIKPFDMPKTGIHLRTKDYFADIEKVKLRWLIRVASRHNKDSYVVEPRNTLTNDDDVLEFVVNMITKLQPK